MKTFTRSGIWGLILFVFLPPFVCQAAENLNLIQVFEQALAYSPKMRSIAKSSLALQQVNHGLQMQRWVNLDATIAQSETLSSIDGNSNWQPSIQLSNTFDIANKKGFEIQINDYQQLILHYQGQLELKSLFANVSEDYYQLIYAKELQAVHRQSLVQISQQAGLLEQGVALGKFAAIDHDRLKIELLNQEQVLLKDQLEINQRQQKLALICGKALASLPLPQRLLKPAEVEEWAFSAANAQNSDRNKSESVFLKYAPELHMSLLERMQENVKLKQAEANWYPSLSISQSHQFSVQSPQSGAQQTLKANLQFKLVDGSRYPQIEAEKSQINALELDYLSQELNLKKTFRTQWADIQFTFQQHQLLTQALAQARINQQKLWEGYQRKFVDITTVLAANRDWLSLEAKYLENLAHYHQVNTYLAHQIQGDIYQ
jgi:outer membrane protein TolC